MPLCVYLCHTPGCQVKVERWMPTAGEGADAKIPCPRCGTTLTSTWTLRTGSAGRSAELPGSEMAVDEPGHDALAHRHLRPPPGPCCARPPEPPDAA